ncbi:MAG: hypothetical protein OYG32_13670, partial [Rhodospirillaceae bacterium]|nr:hypothetical protein [Rhodospirillaceae bacterium]
MARLAPIDETAAGPADSGADWLTGWRNGPADGPDTSPDWLGTARADAAGRFAGRGLPDRRVEDWRYTNLAHLTGLELDWAPAPADVAKESLPALVFGREAECRLVLVNGQVRPALSTLPALPGGTLLTSLADALASGHPGVADLLKQR